MSEEDLLAGADGEVALDEFDENELLGVDIKTEIIVEESIGKTELETTDEADDLYDAAIEPSGAVEKKESVDSITTNGKPASVPTAVPSNVSTVSNASSGHSRRFSFYIGNLTWWTTDEDLNTVIESNGVRDVVEIRFHEFRHNGQSRGFATVVTSSESSMKLLMDRLPGRQIHNQPITVLPFNKNSLTKLEESTRKNEPMEKNDMKQGMVNLGTVRLGPQNPHPLGMRPMMQINGPPTSLRNVGFPQASPLMQMRPSMSSLMQPPPAMNLAGPPPNLNRPPPSYQPSIPNIMSSMGQPHNNVNTAQALNSVLRNHQNSIAGGVGAQPLIPPGSHVNPQVYPYFAQQGQRSDGQRSDISPIEYENIMNRNRSVSQSAISRAISDAANGDINSAVETLMTAMSLIRQSRVSNDEGCKSLLTTLQDALSSIEKKSGSSRKHRRRSRSPERDSRKRHRRGSRSRSRERYSPRHSSRRY